VVPILFVWGHAGFGFNRVVPARCKILDFAIFGVPNKLDRYVLGR